MISFRLLTFVLLVLALASLPGCGGDSGTPKQYVYVAAPQVTLRDRIANVYNKVGTANNGERLEVLERERRFVRVRTPRKEEGWVEQRNLATEEVFRGFQQLAAEHARDPVQAPALARFNVNLHLAPSREGEKLYQIKEGEKLELLSRTSTPKGAPPQPGSDGKQPPPPPLEDWWLVRASGGRTGWVLGRMVDVDIPLEVAQYAEGQRIVAYFVLSHAEDDGKQVPQYLVVLTEPRDGMPFDFNQVRVFTWNIRRDRYETAYRERKLAGVLPVEVGARPFEKEGTLPFFVLRLRDQSGNISPRTYKLNGVIVRRVPSPGEQPAAQTGPKLPPTR